MSKTIKDFLLPYYWKYRFWYDDYPYRIFMRRHKCIFIHIPKTAGSSIILELNNEKLLPRDHSTWFEFKRKSPYLYEKYFKFAFIRNPWDRAVSSYHYFKQGGNQTKKDLDFKKIIDTNFKDFNDFILNYLNSESIWKNKLFWPQWFFIVDENDVLQVNFLGRFENIENDFSFLAEKFFLEKKLSKANESERKNYKEYYNTATKEKIKELYSKDITLFNYQF